MQKFFPKFGLNAKLHGGRWRGVGDGLEDRIGVQLGSRNQQGKRCGFSSKLLKILEQNSYAPEWTPLGQKAWHTYQVAKGKPV